MLLSDSEKKRFIEYLKCVELSSREMEKQLKKLGLPEMIKRERTLIAGCVIIINHLESGESVAVNAS